MSLYLVERNLAEAALEMSSEEERVLKEVNADVGVEWLYSFLSADKKKTICLYEAENPDALREAARRLDIPADEIIEISEVLRPTLSA